MFDHNTLTIGFARRFTGYKRPELIFLDSDRLARILTAPGRAVQIVFAGKAHPADDVGKHHLQRIYRRALDPKFGGRIAFVDDYDLHVAHFLVQGCDVWLNNPRKPLEASGTSGMKAAINGTPHMSIGDGWWAEGFTGDNGWLIEGHADPNDHGAQDWADAQAMYALHRSSSSCRPSTTRDADGIPRRWLQIVKQSIRTVLPLFCARRMVKDYVREMYLPATGATYAIARRSTPNAQLRLQPLQSDPNEPRGLALEWLGVGVAVGNRGREYNEAMAPESRIVAKTKCALCGAKDVSEPRGEERYCRDCWEKKIAVEEIVAREFALKRYIRAHSAEKYLIYHSTIKRPCGQIIVVDDGYDLFLTMVLYPNFGWDEAAYHLEGDPEGRTSPRSSWTSWPPRSSSHGAAANGTSRSSGRPTRSRRTGTAKCKAGLHNCAARVRSVRLEPDVGRVTS